MAGATQRSCAFSAKPDVRAERKLGVVEHRAIDGAAGEGFKGRRTDEATGGVGHHDAHRRAVLHEFADERGGLKGGDASGDSDDNFSPSDRHAGIR